MYTADDLVTFSAPLHDAILERLRYEPAAGWLQLEVQLSCDSDDTLGWFGTFTFEDVVLHETLPPLHTFSFEEAGVLYGVVRVAAEPALSRGEREGYVWYGDMSQPVADVNGYVLRFAARAFKWEPDRSRANPYVD